MSGLSFLEISIPLLIGYLCGSIPFGLLITKAAGEGDVRGIGSGNIGATNVLRTGRKGLAFLTLLADALKGYIVVRYFTEWGQPAAIAAGFGAFVGHLYPVWLNFRGGKGVAVYVGILLAFSWQACLVFAAVWLIVAGIFRYSSLAALAATLATPFYFLLHGKAQFATAILFCVVTILIWVKHQANISRLMARTESKIGASSGG